MDLLQSFPSHLLESEEEQQAVLVHLASDDAVGWMHELVKPMLTGEYQFILLLNSVHGIEHSANRIQRLALTLKRSPSQLRTQNLKLWLSISWATNSPQIPSTRF